jgi:flagellar basal body-associated protein FliL
LKKILLISLGTLLVLCVACVGVLYFVVLPRSQDAIADQFHDGVATVVSAQVAASPIAPGTYVITQEELTDSLVNRVSGSSGANVDGVQTTISPAGIKILIKSDSNEWTVSVSVAAENGELVVTKIESDNWLVKQLMPDDKLKTAIQDGVNSALADQNLSLSAVSLQRGQMTLTTAAK